MNLNTYLLRNNVSSLNNTEFLRQSFREATKLCNDNAVLLGGNYTILTEIPTKINFSSASYAQNILIKSPLNGSKLPLQASNLLDMGIISIIYKGAGILKFSENEYELPETVSGAFNKKTFLIYKDNNKEFKCQEI